MLLPQFRVSGAVDKALVSGQRIGRNTRLATGFHCWPFQLNLPGMLACKDKKEGWVSAYPLLSSSRNIEENQTRV